MANAELLLIKPVEDLGNEGDTVTVKAGYARNYLLPNGLAIPVTKSNLKQIEALRERAEKRRQSELEAAQAISAKLDGIQIVFAVKTGPGGKMFGSVTAADLVAKISENGVELEKKQVNLYTPVKSLGKHTTKIRLHQDVTAEFDFEVVSENPIEDEGGESGAAE